MLDEKKLPDGFEDLLPFVDGWARNSFQERVDARFSSSMSDIEKFYNAMTPRIDEIFTTLDAKPLDDLPPPERRLFTLLMALGHAAHAVERHGQPRPANTMYPNTLRVVSGPKPD